MFNIDKSISKILDKSNSKNKTIKMSMSKISMPKLVANKPMPRFPNMPIFSVKKFNNNLVMKKNRNKSYPQLKKQFNINPLMDSDNDGVMNFKDCRPFNNKKHYLGVFRKGKDFIFDEDKPEDITFFRGNIGRKPEFHRQLFDAYGIHEDNTTIRANKSNVHVRAKEHISSGGYNAPIQIGVYDKDKFKEKLKNPVFFNNLIDALKDHVRKHGSYDDEIGAEFSDESLGFVRDFITPPREPREEPKRELTIEEERKNLIDMFQRLKEENQQKEEDKRLEEQKQKEEEEQLRLDEERTQKETEAFLKNMKDDEEKQMQNAAEEEQYRLQREEEMRQKAEEEIMRAQEKELKRLEEEDEEEH